MSQLLFFILPFFFMHFVFEQEKLQEIDLRVKGIGSGSAYQAVVRNLGKPRRREMRKVKAFDACSGSDETHLTLYYPGLKIKLLGLGKGGSLSVYSIEVTGTQWIVSGIRLGASVKPILTKFGEPNSKGGRAGKTIFYYVTKDNLGGVTFYFRDDRLVRVVMTETLC